MFVRKGSYSVGWGVWTISRVLRLRYQALRAFISVKVDDDIIDKILVNTAPMLRTVIYT